MTSAIVKNVTSIIDIFPQYLKKIDGNNEDESQLHCLKVCSTVLPLYERCYVDCNFCMTVRNYLIYYTLYIGAQYITA